MREASRLRLHKFRVRFCTLPVGGVLKATWYNPCVLLMERLRLREGEGVAWDYSVRLLGARGAEGTSGPVSFKERHSLLQAGDSLFVQKPNGLAGHVSNDLWISLSTQALVYAKTFFVALWDYHMIKKKTRGPGGS